MWCNLISTHNDHKRPTVLLSTVGRYPSDGIIIILANSDNCITTTIDAYLNQLCENRKTVEGNGPAMPPRDRQKLYYLYLFIQIYRLHQHRGTGRLEKTWRKSMQAQWTMHVNYRPHAMSKGGTLKDNSQKPGNYLSDTALSTRQKAPKWPQFNRHSLTTRMFSTSYPRPKILNTKISCFAVKPC